AFSQIIRVTLYLLAIHGSPVVLNAPIGWWFAWRRAQHGKDEALRYFNTFLEDYPIPPKPHADIAKAVDTLEKLTHEASTARKSIENWLQGEWLISNLNRDLRNCLALDLDKFISSVRAALPSGRRFSVADIDELKREYA